MEVGLFPPLEVRRLAGREVDRFELRRDGFVDAPHVDALDAVRRGLVLEEVSCAQIRDAMPPPLGRWQWRGHRADDVPELIRIERGSRRLHGLVSSAQTSSRALRPVSSLSTFG